ELVNGLGTIVWEAEPDHFRFTFVSQKAEAILGLPAARWLAEPDFWQNLIHLEDRAQVMRECRAAVAEGRDAGLEYRAVAGGRVLWLRNLIYVVRAPGGAVRQLRGFMVDVTDRKEAEEALRRSEAQQRLVIDTLPVYIAYCDPQGRYRFVNRGYA